MARLEKFNSLEQNRNKTMDRIYLDYLMEQEKKAMNIDNFSLTTNTGKALRMEASEYVAIYYNEYLAETLETAIESNKLPIGMDIDYALEVLSLCDDKLYRYIHYGEK